MRSKFFQAKILPLIFRSEMSLVSNDIALQNERNFTPRQFGTIHSVRVRKNHFFRVTWYRSLIFERNASHS